MILCDTGRWSPRSTPVTASTAQASWGENWSHLVIPSLTVTEVCSWPSQSHPGLSPALLDTRSGIKPVTRRSGRSQR
jgi:hypothetical protein